MISAGIYYTGDIHNAFAHRGHIILPGARTVFDVQNRRAGTKLADHRRGIRPAGLNPVYVHFEEHFRYEVVEHGLVHVHAIHFQKFPPVVVDAERHTVFAGGGTGFIELITHVFYFVLGIQIAGSNTRDDP